MTPTMQAGSAVSFAVLHLSVAHCQKGAWVCAPAGDAEASAGLPTLALKLLGCIGDEVMTCEPQSSSCLLTDELTVFILKPQQLQEGLASTSACCLKQHASA